VDKIKVLSTDFPRTIQSVQALLVGLVPERGEQDDTSTEGTTNISIDVRDTNQYLIPDPQPRQFPEQVELEKKLAQRQHVIQREEEMNGIRVTLTDALRHILDESSAFGVSFGIGEDKYSVGHTPDVERPQVLAWSQLAELTTCLRVRDLLPSTVTHQDQEMVSQFVAWKWFESLSDETLARLAMGTFVDRILYGLCRKAGIPFSQRQGSEFRHDDSQVEPCLHIYSCHDSSLIGLLCAFRLEQPAKWPEYGSFLKVELIEVLGQDDEEINSDTEKLVGNDLYTHTRPYYAVRFSLNGQVLKFQGHVSQDGDVSSAGMIYLDQLLLAIQGQ